MEQLTVLGAGLIGGSVCLAARRASLFKRIVAVDQTPHPERSDVADSWVGTSDQAAVDAAVATSSLTVLCMPVRGIAAELPRVLENSSGTVTDCGSTKAEISRVADTLKGRDRFVPGHPMAGHPTGGLNNANADLFRGRRWILCPKGSNPKALAAVRMLIDACDAVAVDLGAQEHDRSVALTSHVPQVVASALSVLVDEKNAEVAAGPGYASATRVAGGAEEMWRDIFETNGQEIGVALETLARRLESTGRSLQTGKVDDALDVLELARALRAKSSTSKH